MYLVKGSGSRGQGVGCGVSGLEVRVGTYEGGKGRDLEFRVWGLESGVDAKEEEEGWGFGSPVMGIKAARFRG